MFFRRNPTNKANFNVLILGAGRGGTSLVAGLLDAHPALKMGFEFGADSYFVHPSKPLQEVSLARRMQLFHEYCETRAQKHPEIWGNKLTSEQVFILQKSDESDWLDTFKKEVVQQKKVIFILRDGRTCVASKIARAHHPLQTAINYWKKSIELWEIVQSWQVPLHTVKFENLVENPEEELQKICAFLEIPFDAAMISGTANPKMIKDYQRKSFDKTVLEISAEAQTWMPNLQPEMTAAGYF